MEKTYLLNFKTSTFEFKLPTNTSNELQLIEELEKDEFTKQFLPEINQYIIETQIAIKKGLQPFRYTTIIYKDDIPIGVLSFYDSGDTLVISHAIHPEYRGKRYSSQMKKEVFEYIFSIDPTIKKIIAYVEKTNSNNVRSMSNISNQSVESIFDENKRKEYYVYTSNNPYFTDKLKI